MSLIEFCKEGDLEGAKAALKSGVDVNTKDEIGFTGLMHALSFNHMSVVELLLNSPNIDLNQTNDWGWCALHFAVRCKNNDALKLLLNVPNIDVNIVNKSGRSALLMAVFNNNQPPKLDCSHSQEEKQRGSCASDARSSSSRPHCEPALAGR